jgi:hypothetical protein
MYYIYILATQQREIINFYYYIEPLKIPKINHVPLMVRIDNPQLLFTNAYSAPKSKLKKVH